MPKLLEIEQFIFELKQWLRAYIDAVKNSLDENNFAKITENNIFTGINTFSDVHLYNGNIYWVDSEDNTLAWITYDPTNQLLTLHVNNSELTLSPNLACTVPTNAEVDNSIVTYAFLHGLLQELEARVSFTKDTTITEGSNNIPTTDAVYQFVMANQLTLDDTVTQNSSNGVKSSGIYAALQELDTNLRTLISALDDRISAIDTESSETETYCVDKVFIGDRSVSIDTATVTTDGSSSDNEYTLFNGTLYVLLKIRGDQYNTTTVDLNTDEVQLQVSDLSKCGFQEGDVCLRANSPTGYTSRIIKPTADIRAKGISYSVQPVGTTEYQGKFIRNGYVLASLKKYKKPSDSTPGVHLVGY
jgi:hypothetical protein